MTTASTETQALPHSRHAPKWVITLGAPLAGVIAGLVIGALLILIAGANPIEAYAVMFKGAFGGQRQIDVLQDVRITQPGVDAAGLNRVAGYGVRHSPVPETERVLRCISHSR